MLNGLKIIEIEGIGPGPFAGMMLADMGADVIVVQREKPPIPMMPEKDILNRGKRTVVLDLKSQDDIKKLKQLVKNADGLIEGFRPGVMERLGLGPEELQKDNEKLVYGRMTGWGQYGAKSQDAGHDLNYIALSGALWYASPPEQAPFTPPTMLGDVGGGALYLVSGILAGLLNAGRTGKGTVVDAAIVDGSAHMMNLLMSIKSAGGLNAARGQSLLDGPHWSRCYRCADKQWLSVQSLEPHFYQIFLEKLALDKDEEFLQQNNPMLWFKLSQRLEAIFASENIDHWNGVFDGSDACVAPVQEPSVAMQNEHIKQREIWIEPEGQLQAAPAPRFSSGDVQRDLAVPSRGQHTEEILSSLDE
jgi:crotonobetainyl-CoA:carnitine CoA-transferase CaiB-like acyl-CoA transferase